MLPRILLSFATILAGAIACGAEVTDLSCIQTAPTEYRLAYKLTENSHQVQIFASTDPTGTNGMQFVQKTSQTEVTVHAGSAGQRMYFFLKPDQGSQQEVSIRRLPLEGTPNFRDLGGYETKDGRFVRWGMLYRSGVLSGLTASDLTYLSQLGVKVVCDFRTAQENTVAPEKWLEDPSVVRIAVPIGANSKNGQTASVKSLLENHPTPEELRVRMQQVYQRMVLDSSPQFAKAFRQIIEGPLPMLYHCTAGKDRTGIFTTFVLLSLGVPESTVLTDYELTAKYLTVEAQKKMSTMSANKELAELSPEQARVLMAADPACIRSALAVISEKYGSFDNYRRQALGISDRELEQLKSRVLTK